MALLLTLVGAGCKSKGEKDAEEVVAKTADMRDRLRKAKASRREREEWLKAHPEALNAEPDPDHRPTAPVPSNLPPALFGAPLVEGPPPKIEIPAGPPTAPTATVAPIPSWAAPSRNEALKGASP